VIQFNYALNIKDYTLKNALLYGIFYGHCKKATQGSLANRTVHVIIAGLELLPIFSQIASVFEMLIIARFIKPSQTTLQTPTSFEVFKNRCLSDLPERIKQQQLSPTYKRDKLTQLYQKDLNIPIKLESPPEGVEYFANNATYYGYNAEGVRDYGWGCAWRVIQTCLSSYDIRVPFVDLFHLFGSSDTLKAIYENKNPAKKLPQSKTFAPYDLVSGWAEPFIGHMAMHFFGINSSLENVNGVPASCNAPKEVFHNNSLVFKEFKNKLEDHFKQKNAAPVMIDDGTYALNIIGIGNNGLNTTLWIADPHIHEGVNQGPQTKKPIGLYTVTFNENGHKIHPALKEEDKFQEPHLFSGGSYKGLDFENKHWMVLFPNSNPLNKWSRTKIKEKHEHVASINRKSPSPLLTYSRYSDGKIMPSMEGLSVLSSYLIDKHKLKSNAFKNDSIFVCHSLQNLQEELKKIQTNLARGEGCRRAFVVATHSTSHGLDSENRSYGRFEDFPQHIFTVVVEAKGQELHIALLDPMLDYGNQTINPNHVGLASTMQNVPFTEMELVLSHIVEANLNLNSTKFIKLYYSSVPREKSNGCWAFALKDAVAFINTPDFFDHDNVKKSNVMTTIHDLELKKINTLPSRFMATAQFTDVAFDDYLKNHPEQDNEVFREKIAKHRVQHLNQRIGHAAVKWLQVLTALS
jgi:hypothetical protein